MFGLGWIELIIIAVVVLLLFGSGRISNVMGEVGKGIKAFKSGLNDEQQPKKLDKPTDNPEHK